MLFLEVFLGVERSCGGTWGIQPQWGWIGMSRSHEHSDRWSAGDLNTTVLMGRGLQCICLSKHGYT